MNFAFEKKLRRGSIDKVLLRLHMKIIKFHYEGYEVPVNANELYDFIDLVEGKNFIKVLIIS